MSQSPTRAESPAPSPPQQPPPPRPRLLVVEDLEDTRTSLQTMLQLQLGLEVDVAEDGAVALEMLQQRPYSVVLADLRMPRLDGMAMIEKINEKRLPVTVIVTTGDGGVPEAVKAMRLGAYDFLLKPPDPQHLCLLVQRALRERSMLDEIASLRAQIHGKYAFQNVISKSPRMHSVFEIVEQLSTTTTTVLINGETGTGKEQIARAIHNASSAHRKGPFMVVNCAAFNENLLESELFGHEKGAYTGADKQRKGRFEQAHGGTLFLDEVGDVPPPMQIKLLRVLQERSFERVGGTTSIEVDVRVIAATHQPLEKLIKDGKFREDLYYRLNVMRIELPPLRERPEDVPVLAAFFTERYARPGQKLHISPEVMELLVTHPWPGNVRQLENAIERACVTCRDGTIRPENLPTDVRHRSSQKKGGLQVDLSRPLPEQLSEITASFEERYLRRALKRTRGHVGRCARISGLSRRSITDKIAQYKIDKEEFKK
jgi:DNA-binding NtrC family response regulator